MVFWFLSGLVLELPLPDVRVESGVGLWMFSACFWPEQGFGNSAHGSYGNLGKQTCMSACESIQFLFIFVLRV